MDDFGAEVADELLRLLGLDMSDCEFFEGEQSPMLLCRSSIG